jgi:hypothetical protein
MSYTQLGPSVNAMRPFLSVDITSSHLGVESDFSETLESSLLAF